MSQYRPAKRSTNNSKPLLMESNNIQSQYIEDGDDQFSPQFKKQNQKEDNLKLQKELEKYQNEAQTFRYRLTEQAKQVEEWRNRYTTSQQENANIIQELKLENEELQKQIDILKQQYDAVEDELQQANELNDNLKKEISDWENGFNKLENSYNDLQQTLEMQNLSNDLQVLRDQNQNLSKQLEEKDRVIGQYKDQLGNLQMDIDQLQIDNEFSLGMVKQKEMEIQELQALLDRGKESQRKVYNDPNKTDQLQKEIIRLNNLLKQTHTELQEALNDKLILEQETMGGKQNLEYQQKITLLGQEVERLNNILTLKNRENNDYKMQIQRLQRDIQNFKMNEYKLQDTGLTLDELISQHTEQKIQLQNLNKDLNKKKQFQDQEQELQKLKQDFERAQQISNTTRKEADYLREQLNNYNSIEEEIRFLKQQNEKLINQNRQIEHERQSLLQEYQLLSNSYNTQKFTYQQAIQDQQETQDHIRILKQENSKLVQQLQDIKEQIKIKLNSQNDDQIQQINAANKQINLLKQANIQLQQQYDDIYQKLELTTSEIKNDPKLIHKLEQYEYRFPLLVEEIERLNRILTEREEQDQISNQRKNKNNFDEYSFQNDFESVQRIQVLEAEIERLKQTIILKQQQIDKMKDNSGVQDIVFKLQDENRRLTGLVNTRNNEISELKIQLQEGQQKSKLLENSPQRYEQKINILNEEILNLNENLLEAKNELNQLRMLRNDKFSEERGRILTQELDRQIQINKENEQELMEYRSKFAQLVTDERNQLNMKCLLVLLQMEIERLQQFQQ